MVLSRLLKLELEADTPTTVTGTRPEAEFKDFKEESKETVVKGAAGM